MKKQNCVNRFLNTIWARITKAENRTDAALNAFFWVFTDEKIDGAPAGIRTRVGGSRGHYT
jgi:hypothetical protein